VLEDGERLERERREWHSQATRSLLNTRTRSISRTRAKSLTKTKYRAINKDAPDGTMDFLAARTLLGTQGVKPTVHVVFAESPEAATQVRQSTSVGGMATATATSSHTRSQSHSSNARTDASASQRGHRRAESLGRGIKRAGALCGLTGEQPAYDDQSIRGAAIDAVLRSEGTKHIHLADQLSQERKANGYPGTTNALQLPNIEGSPFTGGIAPSPTPSALSGSGEGIGIAISSPLPPSSDDHSHEHIHMPNHPYALPTSAYVRQYRPEAMEAVSISQEPTAIPSQVPPVTRMVMNDISARHRLPPQATLASTTLAVPHISHPYAAYGASGGSSQHWQGSGQETPSRSMFAEVGAGYVRQIHPDEIRYSPMPAEEAPFEGPHWAEHVYAYRQERTRQADKETLRMGDALSMTLRRRRSKDRLEGRDILSNEEDDEHMGDPVDAPSRRLSSELFPDPSSRTQRVKRRPLLDERVAERIPMPRQTTQLSLPLSHGTMASSPSDHINPPEFRPSLLGATSDGSPEHSGSSPGGASDNTSPPLSPRRVGSSSSDDLDRFRDLFYRPTHSQRAESTGVSIQQVTGQNQHELSRKPSRLVPVDVSSRSSFSGSGLANLTRMLSEGLETNRHQAGKSVISDTSSWDWNQHFSGIPPEDDTTDHIAELLNQMSNEVYPPRASPQSSTIQASIEVAAPGQAAPPMVNVPEDVNSSRASSPLDPLASDNPTDTFGG
jgi:serine/arginine repetitive matrix protein 2